LTAIDGLTDFNSCSNDFRLFYCRGKYTLFHSALQESQLDIAYRSMNNTVIVFSVSLEKVSLWNISYVHFVTKARCGNEIKHFKLQTENIFLILYNILDNKTFRILSFSKILLSICFTKAALPIEIIGTRRNHNLPRSAFGGLGTSSSRGFKYCECNKDVCYSFLTHE